MRAAGPLGSVFVGVVLVLLGARLIWTQVLDGRIRLMGSAPVFDDAWVLLLGVLELAVGAFLLWRA